MASLTLARNWESEDSLGFLGDTSSKQNILNPQENLQKENLGSKLPREQTNVPKQTAKKKPPKAITKIGNLKQSQDYKDIVLESSQVKASALLYEITERTNQLAQPRVREPEIKTLQPRATASQIPKASPRIVELSRPRMIHQHPSKPAGYVSPGALTAIATQRIIELSKPKKKRRLKAPKRRRIGRLGHNSGNSKQYKGKSWCHAGQKTRKGSNFERGSYSQSRNDRRIKKKRTTKRKQCFLESTNSNRTIIMVDINPRNHLMGKLKSVHRH